MEIICECGTKIELKDIPPQSLSGCNVVIKQFSAICKCGLFHNYVVEELEQEELENIREYIED